MGAIRRAGVIYLRNQVSGAFICVGKVIAERQYFVRAMFIPQERAMRESQYNFGVNGNYAFEK
jgi:hypothetical protein